MFDNVSYDQMQFRLAMLSEKIYCYGIHRVKGFSGAFWIFRTLKVGRCIMDAVAIYMYANAVLIIVSFLIWKLYRRVAFLICSLLTCAFSINC